MPVEVKARGHILGIEPDKEVFHVTPSGRNWQHIFCVDKCHAVISLEET
jgi:hypothetical protein